MSGASVTTTTSRSCHEFFTALYGDGELDGAITISYPDHTKLKDNGEPTWTSVHAKTIAEAITTAATWAGERDVFYGVGLRRFGLEPFRRGGKGDVMVLTAFYADIDVAGGSHLDSKKRYFPSREAVLAFADALPLRPSLIVWTGGGAHFYWILREPLELASEDDRDAADRLLEAWGRLVQAEARRRGADVDAVHELARVLRVPGTFNRKGRAPIPVEVIRDSGSRYNVSDFAELAPAAQAGGSRGANVSVGRPDDDVAAPAKLEALLAANPRMKATWECRRTDLRDTSASGYCLALADGAVAAGWSDQEVADLLVAWRQKVGARTKDTIFYTTTITKARTGQSTIQKAHETTSDDSTPAQWEDPLPFDGAVNLPDFPVDALPAPLALFAMEEAGSLQVPTSLMGTLVLGAAGAAVARRFHVQVGRTHTEPTNVYLAAAMEPGERKSAAFRVAVEPIEEFEAQMMENAAPAIARAKERRAREEAELKRLRDQAIKCKDRDEARGLADEAEELAAHLTEVPAGPQLVFQDATSEHLASQLADQGGRIAVFDPDAGAWFDTAGGKYTRDGSPSFDVFLKGYDEDPVRVGRVGRPAVLVRRPRVTIMLSTQPSVLAALGSKTVFRQRGLIGRFGYVLPESAVGTRMYEDRPVSTEITRFYHETLTALLAAQPLAVAVDSLPLHLEGEALNLWAAHADETEIAQREGGRFAGIHDWASKHAGRVARIAGILHCAEHTTHQSQFREFCELCARGVSNQKSGFSSSLNSPSGHSLRTEFTEFTECGCGGRPELVPIGAGVVAAAWRIGDFLTEHALAAFQLMAADPASSEALRILGWIRRCGVETFTLRDVHQILRPVRPTDLLPALAVLEERSYIRSVETTRPGPGRKPSPRWEVNPGTFSDPASRDREPGDDDEDIPGVDA